jgi:hypothetical protein
MADFTLPCPHCGKSFGIRNRQAGQRYLCPHCRRPFRFQAAGEVEPVQPVEFVPLPTSPTATPSPAFIPEDLPASTTVRPQRTRKSAFRVFGPISLAAVVLCVVVLFVWDWLDRRAAPSLSKAATTVSARQQSAADQPVSARPIELLLLPPGARIVIHLHPANLWSTKQTGGGEGPAGQHPRRAGELLATVGPLADWAAGKIEDLCLYPPGQIAEVSFAFGLRSPGEPPDVSALVRLAAPATRAEIEKRFAGTPSSKGTLPAFIKGDRVLIVRDAQSFAIGPAESAQEMLEARDQPNPTDASIEELLKQTDRDCDLTFVFRPDDVDRFRGSLVAPQWTDAAHQLASWLDPEAVEGVVFSVRLADPLRLRLAARTRPVTFAPRFAENRKHRLERLPTDLLKYVQSLRPTAPGSRKLVGRLPAMYKAVALGAETSAKPRLVTTESVLPERAAPNLSLATYLLLTDSPQSPAGSDGALAANREAAKPLAERLQSPVNVDFKRTPLTDAFDAIGSDIGVTFEVDGGALKLAGYTKNTPQTFAIKGGPAILALQKILKAQPKLALLADDARKAIVVTTQEAAASQGKKPLKLGD